MRCWHARVWEISGSGGKRGGMAGARACAVSMLALGKSRGAEEREGEWQAIGLAPGLAPWLAEACSRLGKLSERRKGK